MEPQPELTELSTILSRPDHFDILVVEDDPASASIVKELLELLRYRVRIATTGAEALSEIKITRPDLLLLDWHLPDITGLHLLKEVRAQDPDCTAVMMAADKSHEIVIQSLEAGAEDILEIPLALGELAIRLQNIFEMLTYRAQERALEKDMMREKEMLSRYFSSNMLETILSGEMQAQTGGKTMVATILVFDLRNSTSLAEEMGALPFAEFLNPMMIDIMDLVMDQGGSVARLTGDGLIVTFTEGTQKSCAQRALKCARRIEGYFELIRGSGMSMYSDTLGYGIGIASGLVFAGNIGTHRRLDFTVVGDALARATRLETLTKRLERPVLADRPTVLIAGLDEKHGYNPLRAQVRGRELTLYYMDQSEIE